MTDSMFSSFRIRSMTFEPSLDLLFMIPDHAKRNIVICRRRMDHSTSRAPRQFVVTVQQWRLDDAVTEDVLAVAYIAKHGQLALAHSDSTVSFWDVQPELSYSPLTRLNNQKPVVTTTQDDAEGSCCTTTKHRSPPPIEALCYSGSSDCLFGYSKNSGTMTIWFMGLNKQKLFASVKTAGILSAVAYEPYRLATGGIDGRIAVFDLKTIVKDNVDKDKMALEVTHIVGGSAAIGEGSTQPGSSKQQQQQHAVHSFAYSAKLRFLVSASFDNVASVWDPEIGGYLALQMRLVGHNAPLTDVTAMTTPLMNGNDAHTAATLDCDGELRVWDLDANTCGYDEVGLRARCLRCFRVQSTTLADAVLKPKCLVAAWGNGEALIAATTHRAFYFEASSSLATDSPLTGDPRASLPRVRLASSKWTGQFVIVESRRAVLVDAVNLGELPQSKWHVAPPEVDMNLDLEDHVEITAAAACPRMRKLFVGTADGAMMAYSIAVGKEVATLTPHSDRVVYLEFFPKDDIVISVGADSVIAVHDGTVSTQNDDAILPEMNTRKRLRSLEKAHEQPITAAHASQKLSLIVTASQDSSVRVWDVSLLHLVAVFSVETIESDPLAVKLLDPYPAVAVCEANGALNVLDIYSHRAGRKSTAVLFRLEKHRPGQVDAMSSAIAFGAEVHADGAVLYRGDDGGHVKGWSLYPEADALQDATLKPGYRPHLVVSWKSPEEALLKKKASHFDGILLKQLWEHRDLFRAVEATLEEQSPIRRFGWRGLRSAVLAVKPWLSEARNQRRSFDPDSMPRLIASAQAHSDAIVAVNVVTFSRVVLVATVAKHASVRLFDPQLRPVAVIAGIEASPFTVNPDQHKLLKLIPRLMDNCFNVVTDALLANDDDDDDPVVVVPGRSEAPTTTTAAVEVPRRHQEEPLDLRAACVDAAKRRHGRPMSAPAQRDDDSSDDEDKVAYGNYAKEVTQTLNARLCYHLPTKTVINSVIATAALPSKSSAVAKKRLLKKLDDEMGRPVPSELSLPKNLFTESELTERTDDCLRRCATSKTPRSRHYECSPETLAAARKRTDDVAKKFDAATAESYQGGGNDDATTMKLDVPRDLKLHLEQRKKKRPLTATTRSHISSVTRATTRYHQSQVEPMPKFVKEYGRFGPYELAQVIDCRRVFDLLDETRSGKVHVASLRQKVTQVTETSENFDTQLRGLITVLLAATTWAAERPCVVKRKVRPLTFFTLESFVEVILSDARRDERMRILRTIDVFDLLCRLKPEFRSLVDDDGDFSADMALDVSTVFADLRHGTLTLKEVPFLVNSAELLNLKEEEDVDQLAIVLAVDKDKELDATEFKRLLTALLLSERRKFVNGSRSRAPVHHHQGSSTLSAVTGDRKKLAHSRIAMAFEKFGPPGSGGTAHLLTNRTRSTIVTEN